MDQISRMLEMDGVDLMDAMLPTQLVVSMDTLRMVPAPANAN